MLSACIGIMAAWVIQPPRACYSLELTRYLVKVLREFNSQKVRGNSHNGVSSEQPAVDDVLLGWSGECIFGALFRPGFCPPLSTPAAVFAQRARHQVACHWHVTGMIPHDLVLCAKLQPSVLLISPLTRWSLSRRCPLRASSPPSRHVTW